MKELKTIEEALEFMKKDKLVREMIKTLENTKLEELEELMNEARKNLPPRDAKLVATIKVDEDDVFSVNTEIEYDGTLASYGIILEAVIRNGEKLFEQQGFDKGIIKKALSSYVTKDLEDGELSGIIDLLALKDEAKARKKCEC